jgi:hypothetical protein
LEIQCTITRIASQQKRRDALGSSNADADGMWKHDRHEGVGGGSLMARMTAKEVRPRPDLSAVQSALRSAAPDARGLSIKGAGQPAQPIVEVKGLVSGTTAEDVKVKALRLLFQPTRDTDNIIIQGNFSELWPHLQSASVEHLHRAITDCSSLLRKP